MRIAAEPASRVAERNRKPSPRELFEMLERALKRAANALNYAHMLDLKYDIKNVLALADELREAYFPLKKRVRVRRPKDEDEEVDAVKEEGDEEGAGREAL